MNPFTRHPQSQGITYGEHRRFAMGIACRLLKSAIAFGVHAVFPFVSITRELDLESTAGFLGERNHWIESAGANGGRNRDSGRSRDGRNAGIGLFDSDLPPDLAGNSGSGDSVFTAT